MEFTNEEKLLIVELLGIEHNRVKQLRDKYIDEDTPNLYLRGLLDTRLQTISNASFKIGMV